MLDLKTIVSKGDSALTKADRAFAAESRPLASLDFRQRRLMVGALCLLLLALGILLWRNRDYWIADTSSEAESAEPVESLPVPTTVSAQPSPAIVHDRKAKPSHQIAKNKIARKQIAKSQVAAQASSPATPDPSPPGAIITARTVLPPLEVEVVAGDTHRTIRPGNNSIRVDLQPGTAAQPSPDAGAARKSENVTHETSEPAPRVQMSPTTSDAVTRTVSPNYPLLARQMKVQGSVILQALIGKDGVIQNLRVMSGPQILASAAQDAVRQWHFKPHYDGTEAVETEAKITVNFTISTN